MRSVAAGVCAIVAIVLSGACNHLPSDLAGNIPRSDAIVPATSLRLTPSTTVELEKIVNWGLYAGIAYLVADPLAPNWEIEEAKLPNDNVHLSLRMKRYYVGGAGEARTVFQRRAQELMRAGGYAGYQVLEYNEGVESSVLGSRRVVTGVVQLTGKPLG